MCCMQFGRRESMIFGGIFLTLAIIYVPSPLVIGVNSIPLPAELRAILFVVAIAMTLIGVSMKGGVKSGENSQVNTAKDNTAPTNQANVNNSRIENFIQANIVSPQEDDHPEEREANVQIEEYPLDISGNRRLNFRVVNNENLDLTKCSARLDLLEHYYNPSTVLDVRRKVNPDARNMVWASDAEFETVGRKGGEQVLRFCFDRGNDLGFFFFQHLQGHYLVGKYHVKIAVNGYLGKTPIKPVLYDGCFELTYKLLPQVEVRGEWENPKTGEVSNVHHSVGGGTVMTILQFVEC